MTTVHKTKIVYKIQIQREREYIYIYDERKIETSNILVDNHIHSVVWSFFFIFCCTYRILFFFFVVVVVDDVGGSGNGNGDH